MIRRTGIALSAFGFLVGIPLAGWAGEPSFSDLLARAHAQASAGHQWAPPGDNVAETFMAMVNLLPEATPEQLADFEALLREQQKQIATSSLDSLDSPTPEMKPPTESPPVGTPTQQAGTASPPDAASPGAPDQPPGNIGAADAPSSSTAPNSVTATAAAPASAAHPVDETAGESGSADAAGPSAAQASAKAERAMTSATTGTESVTNSSAPAATGTGTAEATRREAQPDAKPESVAATAAPAPAVPPDSSDQAARGLGAEGSIRLAPKPVAADAAAQPPTPVSQPDPADHRNAPADAAPQAPRQAATVAAVPPPVPAAASPTPPPSPPVTVAKAMPLPEPAESPPPRLPTLAPQPNAQPAQPDHPTTVASPKQVRTSTPASREFANVMFTRGRAAEAEGDISGARRFYTAAAQNGIADAARALARLYDLAYLREKTIGGIEADPQLSQQWRDRAAEIDARASPVRSSPSQPQAMTAR